MFDTLIFLVLFPSSLEPCNVSREMMNSLVKLFNKQNKKVLLFLSQIFCSCREREREWDKERTESTRTLLYPPRPVPGDSYGGDPGVRAGGAGGGLLHPLPPLSARPPLRGQLTHLPVNQAGLQVSHRGDSPAYRQVQVKTARSIKSPGRDSPAYRKVQLETVQPIDKSR